MKIMLFILKYYYKYKHCNLISYYEQYKIK